MNRKQEQESGKAWRFRAYRARTAGLGFALAALLTIPASLAGIGSVLAADSPKAVVELFTSQGCSSCPPADKYLAVLAKRKDVLALSWHVDYWNYLGWKDTFSHASFTERQQRYAVSFGKRSVYTPQAVVNGRDHAVGSRKRDIDGLISKFEDQGKGLRVKLNISQSQGGLNITADEAALSQIGYATAFIVSVDKSRAVKIQRGENAGETVVYHNVVRQIVMAGMTHNGKLDLTLPIQEIQRGGGEAFAVILQKTTKSGSPGPIVGATIIQEFAGS